MTTDEQYMQKALREAEHAAAEGEVPIGAVVVCRGRVLASAHNLTEMLHDVTAHAEMQAITAAANALGGKYLSDCTLYVTVEPCPMCAAAISLAKIKNIYFSTLDIKGGAVISGIQLYKNAKNLYKPRVNFGYLNEESSILLKKFFVNLRKNSLK